MADNVINSNGDVIAADEVAHPDFGDSKIQLTKITDGRTNGTTGAPVDIHGLYVDVQASVLPTGASTSANQSTELTWIGDVTETAPATDTASSGLNGRLQRIAQRISTFIGLIPAALTGSGNFKVAVVESTVTQVVSGTVTSNAGTNLNTSALALEAGHLATIDTTLTEISTDIDGIETAVANIPAQGQALEAASMPVVLPAAQITTLTPPAAITNYAAETGGNLAAAKADLDTIAGAVSSSKVAVKEADGDDATFGAKADSAATDPTTTNTFMAFFKGALSLWGSLTEAEPATDTASSGLNGRMQRIAQRITSLIALIPAALGQGTMAQSLRVVVASDQSTLPVSQNAATTPASTLMQNGAGTGNPNGTSLPVTGYAVAILNVVSGTPMSGGTTINFEASVDDTTWVSIAGHQIGVSGNLVTTTTADGDFRFSVAGYKSLRARISAWSVGVTTVKGYATPVTGPGNSVSVDASSGLGANIGTTSGAAVVTDASGTLQQFLRGIVAMWADIRNDTGKTKWINVRRVKVDQWTSGSFTITLASLASGSAEQSTLLTSNTTESAVIYVKVTTGATPVANGTIDLYLIRSDGTIADDNAGANDAAITILNAQKIGSLSVTATANAAYRATFGTGALDALGPNWGIAIVNNTGFALNATGGNHAITYNLRS